MRDAPPVTEQMREAARSAPDSWLYVLEGDEVVGAYPVDEHGEVVEDFQHNPDHVPGAVEVEPTDPLDAALHELSAGRGSREAVLALLRTAELLVRDGAGEGLVVHTTPAGRDVVQAYSSQQHAPTVGADAGWQTRRGRELARVLPVGVALQLNPGSPVSVTVPRESLLR